VIRHRLLGFALAAVIGVGGLGSVATGVATAAKKDAPAHVVIAPGKTKPGDKCAKGVAGCQDGRFNGNFFGH